MSLQRDSESFLEKQYQFQGRDRIEHATGDKRRRIGQFVRIFARQELMEDELLERALDCFPSRRRLPFFEMMARWLVWTTFRF
jgi:hypothetical protein